jgi:hypothetical protein
VDKHNRLYSILLVALILNTLAGVGIMAGVLALSPAHRPPTHLPVWSFPLVACLTGAYACAAGVVLYLRIAEPEIGRRVTRGFNIALLFGPPLGTALGLYGLWKVDRRQSVAAI